MATQLSQILTFPNLAPGASLSVPHNINVSDRRFIPDIILRDDLGFTITSATDTQVTARNDKPIPSTLNVWLWLQHTIDRAYGGVQNTNLVPNPFIPGGFATGPTVVTNEGNTVIVDQIFGNDATGQRQGLPFQTVGAALAVALPGDAVMVRPGTYDLPAGITIPDGVALVGAAPNVTMLRMLNVVADTTLMSMGLNTRLEGFELELTSAQHHTLVGIDFPGQSAESGRVRSCRLFVDNSGAGAGNSNVIGVQSSGTGSALAQIENLRGVNLRVASIGAGTKRGILVDGLNNTFTATDVIVTVENVGIGIETNNVNCNFVGQVVIASGADADISQTQGILSLGGASDLVNVNANGLGFTTLFHPNTMQFGDPGNLPAATRFFYPGTEQVSNNPVLIRIPSAAVFKGLSIRATTPPGAGNACTVTVQKNGVDTALAVTLNNAETSKTNTAVSAGFAAGDDLSMKVENTGATADVIAVVEMY